MNRYAILTLALLAMVGVTAVALRQDRIVVVVDNQANDPVHDAAVFLSGNHYGGCFCDTMSGSENEVGNVMAGRSQVAVQSASHALRFDPDVKWTMTTGERYQARMKSLLDMRVQIWVLSPLTQNITPDIDFAKGVAASEMLGFTISETVVDVSSSAGMPAEASCSNVDAVTKLKDPRDPTGVKVLFDEHAVNVYYTASCGETCDSEAGQSCPDPRVNFVYSIRSHTTLMHELGHALLGRQGIDHWNLSVSPNNLMDDSVGAGRDRVSTGQAITMSYDKDSVIQKLGLGPPGLNCVFDCPRLELDASWTDCVGSPGAAPPSMTELEAWYDCVECTGRQLETLLSVQPSNDRIFTSLRDEIRAPQKQGTLQGSIYQGNAAARRQRRAMKALEMMARRNHDGARAEIERTHNEILPLEPKVYRPDVEAVIVRSYRALYRPPGV